MQPLNLEFTFGDQGYAYRVTAVWRGLGLDLRLALRQLWRRPAFAITCIFALALGLGAATAIFSLLYSSVLKPLPYRAPDQLVALHTRYPQAHLPRLGLSVVDYLELQNGRDLFRSAGAYFFLDLSRTGIEIPEKVNAVAVTASLFDTLGVAPRLGRNFNDNEQGYHGPHAVILSEGYWRREFASDPAILQKSLQLNGCLHPVVGVMPRTFQFPNDVTEMWTAIQFAPQSLDRSPNRAHFLRVFARLAPNLDFDRAEARVRQLSPLGPLNGQFFILPMNRDDDGTTRRWLYLLFAGALALWVIVCSNVAGLFLVRATERHFDLWVRMALGASRWRIARQVLMEILVLSLAGALFGFAIANAGAQKLVAELMLTNGFQAELIAADPEVRQPIAFAIGI